MLTSNPLLRNEDDEVDEILNYENRFWPFSQPQRRREGFSAGLYMPSVAKLTVLTGSVMAIWVTGPEKRKGRRGGGSLMW